MVNAAVGPTSRMMRGFGWKQAVFIATGVPALVLFSGGVAACLLGYFIFWT